MPSPPSLRSPSQAPRRRLPAPDLSSLTFGRPNRPSTPIIGVITNQYQREWIEQQERLNQKRKKRAEAALLAAKIGERQKGQDKVRAQHTRASLGHMKVCPLVDAVPDTTAKFQHVEKKIQTRWEQMPGRRGQTQTQTQTQTQYADSTGPTTASERE